MCWHAHRIYPPDLSAPRSARRFTTDHLTGAFADDDQAQAVVGDAILVLSELVANAVEAGSTSLEVDVNLHQNHLRLVVIDDAEGAPEVRDPTGEDERGRGLRVVDALARAWGVMAIGGGKQQVWAVLSVPPQLTRRIDCTVATFVAPRR